jgi:DNA-binding CsgD family transcriptional regulator
VTALKELAAGKSEVDVAEELGVNRLTVRAWRGKPAARRRKPAARG